MSALIPRPLAPVADSLSITVPETQDALVASMDALGGAINAGGWATAAVVYAWTEPTDGGRPKSGEKSSLTLSDFAALNIRGLTTRDSVRKYRSAWERAMERGWAGDARRGEPVALPDKDFKETEDHVGANSGENEWYTPAAVIESARIVMGGIDLDPASTEVANEVVGAATFYTAEQDGLDQPWRGRVWMNPPYARPLIDQFCTKLADEYAHENIEQAIVLVNNATDTSWFGQLARVASAACFTSRRVRFWHPERESAPLQGQAIVYFGPNVEAFLSEFKAHGHTWVAL